MNLDQAYDLADRLATQVARVAAVLELDDPDAYVTVESWRDHRAKIGRPIRSAAAVLATMTDRQVRDELSRHAPHAQPGTPALCPRCRPTAGWVEDPDTGQPIARCTHQEHTQ